MEKANQSALEAEQKTLELRLRRQGLSGRGWQGSAGDGDT